MLSACAQKGNIDLNSPIYSSPNWQSEAPRYLLIRDNNRPVSIKYLEKRHVEENGGKIPRCILMNNYWCMKAYHKWSGTIGRDNDRHSVFKSAKHGARAAAALLREMYVVRGLKSAENIMSQYAPDSDCVGSSAGRNPDGSCRLIQNSAKYARFIAKNLGLTQVSKSGRLVGDYKQDLKLIDANGKPTERLGKLMALIAIYETGYVPTQSLLKYGVRNMRRGCSVRRNCR